MFEIDKNSSSTNLILQTRFFKNQVQINGGSEPYLPSLDLSVSKLFHEKTYSFAWIRMIDQKLIHSIVLGILILINQYI